MVEIGGGVFSRFGRQRVDQYTWLSQMADGVTVRTKGGKLATIKKVGKDSVEAFYYQRGHEVRTTLTFRDIDWSSGASAASLTILDT